MWYRMTTRLSSTAAATSDIAKRISEVLSAGDSDRRDRVAAAVASFERLAAMGLIKKSRYVKPSTGDLRRLYLMTKADKTRSPGQ